MALVNGFSKYSDVELDPDSNLRKMIYNDDVELLRELHETVGDALLRKLTKETLLQFICNYNSKNCLDYLINTSIISDVSETLVHQALISESYDCLLRLVPFIKNRLTAITIVRNLHRDDPFLFEPPSTSIGSITRRLVSKFNILADELDSEVISRIIFYYTNDELDQVLNIIKELEPKKSKKLRDL